MKKNSVILESLYSWKVIDLIANNLNNKSNILLPALIGKIYLQTYEIHRDCKHKLILLFNSNFVKI